MGSRGCRGCRAICWLFYTWSTRLPQCFAPALTRLQRLQRLVPSLPATPTRSYIYNQMRGVLDASFASPTSPYAARIAANPQLYGLVRTRLEQYAAELQPVAGQATTAKVTPRRGSRRGRAAAAAATPSP